MRDATDLTRHRDLVGEQRRHEQTTHDTRNKRWQQGRENAHVLALPSMVSFVPCTYTPRSVLQVVWVQSTGRTNNGAQRDGTDRTACSQPCAPTATTGPVRVNRINDLFSSTHSPTLVHHHTASQRRTLRTRHHQGSCTPSLFTSALHRHALDAHRKFQPCDLTRQDPRAPVPLRHCWVHLALLVPPPFKASKPPRRLLRTRTLETADLPLQANPSLPNAFLLRVPHCTLVLDVSAPSTVIARRANPVRLLTLSVAGLQLRQHTVSTRVPFGRVLRLGARRSSVVRVSALVPALRPSSTVTATTSPSPTTMFPKGMFCWVWYAVLAACLGTARAGYLTVNMDE